MGIIGATQLVAAAKEAEHLKNLARWSDHFSTQPLAVARRYIATHDTWWWRLIALMGFNDKLLAAHAVHAQRSG